MRQANREIEIKLRFDSADEARTAVADLGAKTITPRTFEDNVLYDRPDASLRQSGGVLRLRRYGDEYTLTYKAKVEGQHRHRVRIEEESHVADPEAIDRILSRLGFNPMFRYQKFRTLLELEELHICLDETPLGCFVELEGSPAAIDRAASDLGRDEPDFVRDSYVELHLQAAAARGETAGDMVFDEDPSS